MFILSRTVLGRYTFALGSNEEATRLSGVNVDIWKMAVYTLAGTFAGLAGVVEAPESVQVGIVRLFVGLEDEVGLDVADARVALYLDGRAVGSLRDRDIAMKWNLKGESTWAGAIIFIRSSIFSLLCACFALDALYRKRST